MRQTGFEVVVKAATFIFFKGLTISGVLSSMCLCALCGAPMGGKIGYLVDGRLVTNEQMKEVLKDE